MTRRTTFTAVAAALVAATALLITTIDAQNPDETRERMIALGRQHASASALYDALKAEAGGGRRLAPARLPDWTGVYTRARGGITFDPDQAAGAPPTAKLTPEFQRKLEERIDHRRQGGRVGSDFHLRAARTSALADRAVPQGVRRHARTRPG